MEKYQNLRIAELKAMLQQRNLCTRGRKSELIERLEKSQDTTQNKPSTQKESSACSNPRLQSPHVLNPIAKVESVVTTIGKISPTMNQPDTKTSLEDITSDSEQVKLAKRAKRFGTTTENSEEAKLKARALRFGLASPELEKIKREGRAERFNFDLSDEATKRQLRAMRFGLM